MRCFEQQNGDDGSGGGKVDSAVDPVLSYPAIDRRRKDRRESKAPLPSPLTPEATPAEPSTPIPQPAPKRDIFHRVIGMLPKE